MHTSDSVFLDEYGPLPSVQPTTVAEASDLVPGAAADGSAVYPFGGRTMLNFGLPPTKTGIAVDMTYLNQVLDFPARDMTITVQAGITLARLREITAAENLRLPVDVPQAERATLGGAIATNMSGPRRYSCGTLRDYVIGISVINDEGQETKAGGRVVKNVAGYDLCKLHVGALGTLGIISQATLKLKPLPEDDGFVLFSCDASHLDSALDRVHRSRTRPVCVDVLNSKAARAAGVELPDAPWVVVVGFEQNRDAVAWELKTLAEELSGESIRDVVVRNKPATARVWEMLVNFTARPESALIFKANILPHAAASFCREFSEDCLLHAHAGSGIVLGHLDQHATLEQATTLMQRVRHAAASAGGNVVLLRCPTAWKKELPVWGNPRADAWLMKAVKDKLDSRGIFNPGRFVAGI
jgi:glycolate oxidase FAD binding subunit